MLAARVLEQHAVPLEMLAEYVCDGANGYSVPELLVSRGIGLGREHESLWQALQPRGLRWGDPTLQPSHDRRLRDRDEGRQVGLLLGTDARRAHLHHGLPQARRVASLPLQLAAGRREYLGPEHPPPARPVEEGIVVPLE